MRAADAGGGVVRDEADSVPVVSEHAEPSGELLRATEGGGDERAAVPLRAVQKSQHPERLQHQSRPSPPAPRPLRPPLRYISLLRFESWRFHFSSSYSWRQQQQRCARGGVDWNVGIGQLGLVLVVHHCIGGNREMSIASQSLFVSCHSCSFLLFVFFFFWINYT